MTGRSQQAPSGPDRRWMRRTSPALLIALALFWGMSDSASAREDVDVLFVLDNSGSMKQSDPAGLTRRSVHRFADALAAQSDLDGRLGVVLFDAQARLVQPLTDAKELSGTQTLDRALAALDFSGQWTQSGAGVERALYELRAQGRPGAHQAIVLLSDGRIDTGDPLEDSRVSRWLREDLAKEGADEDVLIFGIAFTDAADYQLMQALARRTRADYYRVFVPEDLSRVVDDVLTKLRREPEPTSTALAPSDLKRVSAAPLAEPNPLSAKDTAPGRPTGGALLGWIPIALLVVGAALYLRNRQLAPSPPAAPTETPNLVPDGRLLDLGGYAGESGKTLPMNGRRTRIGRDPSNDIVLSDDTVSSEHAVIEVREGRHWLEDLRSTNGTRLGSHRLEPRERVALKGGDRLCFADVELMFVVEGYVPAGATAYLSHSTTPPNEDVIPGVQIPLGDAIQISSPPEPRPSDLPFSDPGQDERTEHVGFVEHPADFDPAAVADLDEVLRQEFAEAATDPFSRAKATPDQTDVQRCLDYHLSRVQDLSPAFQAFVERAFDEDLRGALTRTAQGLIETARTSGRIEQSDYTQDRIRYVLCAVPGSMDAARDLFAQGHGGFTRVLAEHLDAESFRAERCEILSLLSFGFSPQEGPWVSLSVVPEKGREPHLDLLSYEFLTDAERREIDPSLDLVVSQSGLR